MQIRKRSVASFSGGKSFAVSAVKGNMMKSSDMWRMLVSKQDKEVKKEMRKFWVPLLNVSLKCHADAFAGRQIHQN